MHCAASHAKVSSAPHKIAEFFKGHTEAQQSVLIASGAPSKFEGREIIIRSDEPALRLYLLRSGHVNFFRIVETGDQVLLARLVPNDIFGLGSLVTEPLRYIGTAETVD